MNNYKMPDFYTVFVIILLRPYLIIKGIEAIALIKGIL
jgi:hypothetical protein